MSLRMVCRLCVVVLSVFCLMSAGAAFATGESTEGQGEKAAPTAPSGTPSGVSDEVPADVRAGIENALKEKVSSLLKEKNAEGTPYKRGSYSKHFIKVDDATYMATFHVDTADLHNMQTERFLFTLKKDPAKPGKWSIASEELKDTYKDLYRKTFNNVSSHTFDKFTFSKEGLTVSASKGSYYEVKRNGKVEGFILSGKDLKYEYIPPVKLDQIKFAKMKKDHPDDVLFQPQILKVDCDPMTCEEFLKTAVTSPAGIEVAQLDPAVKKEYDEAVKDDKKNREEDWFRGFLPLYEQDRRVWTLELRREGVNDQRLRLSFDNYDPREVTFSVYGLYESFPFWIPVYSYYSEETRNSGVNALDLERRDDAGRRDYDLQRLTGTVEMALEDSETMTADLIYGLKTKKEVRYLPFFIARLTTERADRKDDKNPKMFVNSVRDKDGNDLTFVKLRPSFGLVVFPKPVPAGTEVEIHTTFENKDAIDKMTPSFSYVSRGGWLPFVRFGDMIHEFDLTVKVPSKYQTLGIGKKISDVVEGDVRVTRWVPDAPIDFPTVIYGDYIEEESSVKAVKSDGSPIKVMIHVDKAGFSEWQIPPKSLKVFADEAANALNLYREIYGVDYPYSKLDLVNDPRGGLYGQAPSSIVYLGSEGFHKALLGSLGGGYLTQFVKSLVAHETAHQWWGSLIGNANDRNYWFVESLAEYSAALFVENVHSPKEYMEHVNLWRKEILETDMQVSVQDASVLWGGDDFGAYRAAVYSKGPYAFHIMRSIWGEEKFFKFLKMMAQDLAGKEIVTRDIQKEAEKAFGGNMEWFFDQWLRGVGIPEFTFHYSVRPTEDGKYLVEGKVDQRLVVGQKRDVLDGQFFLGVIPITITGKDGKEYRYPLKVEGASTPFKFKVGEIPRDVVFNKYGETLALDVIVNKT